MNTHRITSWLAVLLAFTLPINLFSNLMTGSISGYEAPQQRVSFVGESSSDHMPALSPDGYLIDAMNDSGSGFITNEATKLENTGNVLTNDINPYNFVGYDTSNTIGVVSLSYTHSPGEVDAAFGENGQVITDFGSSERGRGMILQPDGKIVLAGDSSFQTYDFFLARYTPDGHLDSTFDGDGKITTDLGGYELAALAYQLDGKLLLLSSSYSSDRLVRYTTTGSLDASFNGNGTVTLPYMYPQAVQVQLDGKIIVGGGPYLIRYNSDGSLDESFGTNGLVVSSGLFGLALMIQPDGKILFGGSSSDGYFGGKTDFTLARFNPDGSVDTSFDSDGFVRLNWYEYEYGYSLALQADGKILLAGSAGNSSSSGQFAVVRFNADGSLDTSFGGGGLALVGIYASCNTVVVQLDGKILLGGGNFGIARLNVNGSLDTNWGSGGIITSLGDQYSNGRSLIIQPDGKILFGGSGTSNGTDGLALTRLIPANAQFSYDPNRKFESLAAGESAVDTFTYTISNGTITDMATVSITVFGVNDPPIANDNIVSTLEDTPISIELTASDIEGDSLTYTITQQPSKGILSGIVPNIVYTPFPNVNGDDRFSFVVEDGSLNSNVASVVINIGSVNDAPDAANDEGQDYSTDEDTSFITGNILKNDSDVEGDPIRFVDFNTEGTLGQVSLDTLTVGGELDSSLDQDGKVVTNFGGNDSLRDVVLQADGKIILAGSAYSNNYSNIALARYNPEGSRDVSFGTNGKVITDLNGDGSASGGMLLPGGKLLVTAYTYVSSSTGFLIQYLPNGTIDTSYGTNGWVSFENFTPYTINIIENNKILLGGISYNGSVNCIVIIRCNSDGSLDTSFGNNGRVTTILSGSVSESDLAMQPDGKIVVGGSINDDFFLTRYNSDGSLDASWGFITADVSIYDRGGSLAIAPDGQIYLGGYIYNGNNYDFSVINYNSDGALNTSFGQGGKVSTDFGRTDDWGTAIALQADGKIIMSGYSDYNFSLVRYQQNGDLDNSFGIQGKVTTDFGGFDTAKAIEIQPDGNILLGGTVYINDYDFAMVRYLPETSATFNYSPNGQFDNLGVGETAQDTFEYTITDDVQNSTGNVTLTIHGVNDAPVATNDSFSTSEGDSLEVAAPGVLGNDVDADGDPLTPSLVSSPEHGALIFNLNGSFTYTPDAAWSGTDTFTYKLNDGIVDSDAATITITVTGINDPPVAVNESYVTAEDTPLTVAAPGVLDNDTDSDNNPLTAIKVTDPAHGTLTLNTNGSFTYTPATNWNGGDSFTYKANDGTSNSNVATVTLTVTAVNDLPVADNQNVTTNEDTAKSISITATDADSDPLTWIVISNPSHGTLLGTAPDLSYTPSANWNGTDTFTFKVNDGSVDSNVATVSIDVTPINDAPVALNNGYTSNEDTPKTIPAPGVLGNDIDVDGDSLTAIIVANPTHGTLSFNANGSFTYTPDANWNGPDNFTYKANDSLVDSNEATVTITVNAINDPPVANNQSVNTAQDTPKSITLTGSDIEDSTLTWAIIANPAHGALSGTAPNVTYTPAAGWSGTDTFSFKVNDGTADSNIATVSILVTAVNAPPVAVNDDYNMDEDTVLSIEAPGVLSNDTDVDSDPLTVILVTGPAHGTLTLNADGSFTYTPDANWHGAETFMYTVYDGSDESNVATVTITVADTPDTKSIYMPLIYR